jgi:hypothetical protein
MRTNTVTQQTPIEINRARYRQAKQGHTQQGKRTQQARPSQASKKRWASLHPGVRHQKSKTNP